MNLVELRKRAAAGTLTGFHKNISNEDYHAGPGISSSGVILAMETSLATFKASRSRPVPPTEEMELGTATHTLLLEEKNFKKTVTYLPDDCIGRLKAAKEGRGLFELANKGKIIIPDKETFDSIPEMVSSIRDTIAVSEIPNILTGGESELSCYSRCPRSGILRKVRSDYIHRRERMSVNFKTSRSVYDYEFSKSIIEWSYHVQTGYYIEVLSDELGGPAGEMHIVCEKKPPYLCVIGFIDDGSLDKGRDLFRPVVEAMGEAERTGIWPAIKQFSIPHYGFYK